MTSGDGVVDPALLEACAAELERAVRTLPGGSGDRPTPAGMTVRELLQHLVVGNRLTTALLTGVPRSQVLPSLVGDQLGDDPVGAVVASSAAQTAAFAAVAPDRVLEGPGGDTSVADFQRFRVVDLVVHAWDLRRGAELEETLEASVVERVWALVEPALASMLAFGVYGDGPSGTLPADADTQTRLLDALGRRPWAPVTPGG
ncbi:maleylpyruvate isomerase N-terminal domain-containing protein [Desertihabitans aurantiacus]|uniref:maleylpyruvate isomerase N-terminal domain-containing protein n=1 Tax=Desertihabitans aurantiacus TaxID=2282477 RepID=UPI001E316B6E|nr:maleylpyruvate isomerase N-terminal domain-containing protein [Desertihabitans aurantiacus]